MTLNRKEFLRKFAALGLTSPFMGTLLSSCSDPKTFNENLPADFKDKVLIIGAGAAGITAGHILTQKQIDFEILEAAALHGGRVKKLEGFADFPIDIGGEWIHKWINARPPVLDHLMENKELDFPTFKDSPKTISNWKDGKLKSRNIMRHLIPDDHKFSNSTWFDFIDHLVTPDMEQKIRYNNPVTKIDYSQHKVVVQTKHGDEYIADKVLITTPIKMLQNGFIEFVPSLPAAQMTAIKKEQMPGGLKVFIAFSERFYPDMLLFGSLSEIAKANHTYYNAANGKTTQQNILGLFAVDGPSKRYTSHKSEADIIEYILKELDEIFDGQASKHYLKHHIQNWTDEPFIQGSYSKQKGDPKKMAAPVAGKIYFAGEAMNIKGHTIAVHGAMESSYLMLEKMLKK